MEAWRGFKGTKWQEKVNVRDFIQENYRPYEGDDSFLVGPSEKTKRVWNEAGDLIHEEIITGQIPINTTKFSSINGFEPAYLDKENEVIVGFQGEAPMERIVNPYGGYRMVLNSLQSYGVEMDPINEKYFNEYRKTHNQGVFDAYTNEMRLARTAGLITGLPDAYGRGRIIGDYRRVALYGIDFLKREKITDKENIVGVANAETITHREELSEQIRALDEMKMMAESYGFDISKPAENARQAAQWLYFGYLAAIKENNGAAMSIGRNTTFLDIYIQRDLDEGLIDENEAQEIVDQFVIKLRMARHLRTPEYNELFAGDPTWVTESIGGMGEDGRTLVTKTAFRFLHTLINLDSAPEPNMTVLWSEDLPREWKLYCAKISMETGSIQYENDDAMRPIFGDDYAIACCVSAMRIGKDMQYFGARANIAKALLYSLNGGVDEMKKAKDGSPLMPLGAIPYIDEEILTYETTLAAYKSTLAKLAPLYVNTLNTIHFMHDKYAYERGQMALHDSDVNRTMAFGVAGLSIVCDSLSAIKYAKVRPIRNEEGITVDFEIEGDYPQYGNDDDRVDQIAVEILEFFMDELRKTPTIRNAEHTLSVLTITSNVVYGKKTGATPDGRKKGVAFAPGANPMHGRDNHGALASLNSVAKLPYKNVCQDGISNTFSIVPNALGNEDSVRRENLVNIMDGYFSQDAFHLNVNVLNREKLIDAYNNPDKYPNLTIRISGYAVHFNRLTDEQKKEVIARTFHDSI